MKRIYRIQITNPAYMHTSMHAIIHPTVPIPVPEVDSSTVRSAYEQSRIFPFTQSSTSLRLEYQSQKVSGFEHIKVEEEFKYPIY
jgi:hypothetical protein